MGIVARITPLNEAPQLIAFIKQSGLVLLTWGAENNCDTVVDMQLKLGVDAVITDHVKHFSNQFA